MYIVQHSYWKEKYFRHILESLFLVYTGMYFVNVLMLSVLSLIRYNCEDKNCYKDLARQRGLLYLTWENQSLLDQEDEVSSLVLYELY